MYVGDYHTISMVLKAMRDGKESSSCGIGRGTKITSYSGNGRQLRLAVQRKTAVRWLESHMYVLHYCRIEDCRSGDAAGKKDTEEAGQIPTQ